MPAMKSALRVFAGRVMYSLKQTEYWVMIVAILG